MIVSKLIHNNIAYYCLHAEVTYFNFENGILVGIDPKSAYLTKNVFDPICRDILNDKHSVAFVLDFDSIETIQSNAIEVAISDLCNEHHKNVVLANVKESIIAKQSKSFVYLVEKNKEYLIDKDAKFYSYFSIRETDCNQLSNYEKVFNQVVKDNLKKYTRTE